MALTFDLTEDATVDLEEAAGYLTEKSESAALALADGLEQAFLFLAEYPELGRVQEAFDSPIGLRFWSSAGYQMAYLSDQSPILILAILHRARDAQPPSCSTK